jgi:O-antigen/teichoic acid export membrane protein
MLKGIIYLFAGQLAFACSNLILHSFLGKTLGPEAYGIFGLLNALITLNEVLFMKALTESISKSVAENTGSVRSLIRAGTKLQAIISLPIALLLFFLSPYLAKFLHGDASLLRYLKFISLLIPISALAYVYLGALNGVRSFGRQAIVWIGFSFSRLVLCFLFVHLGYGMNGVVLALIFSAFVQLAIAHLSCRRFQGRGTFSASALYRFTPQLILISISTAILMNIDLLAVKSILADNRLTGLYASSITLARAPLIFLAPLTLTIFPSIAKATVEKDAVYIKKLINDSLRLLLILIMPITFIVMATARPLLTLFYGKAFIGASLSLSILIVGLTLHSVKVLMFNVIVASGKPRIPIAIGLFSVVLEIVLILALIHRYSIAGVALATTITDFAGFVLAVSYVFYRFKTLVRLSSLFRILAASVVTYCLGLFIARYIVAFPVIYLTLPAIFLALLLATRELNIRDLLLSSNFLNVYYQNRLRIRQ